MPKLINLDDDRNCYIGNDGEYERYNIDPDVIVEAVDIIHCRECKHYHENVWGGEVGLGKPYDDIIVGHHGCDRWGKDGKDMAYTSPDGFCFLGERRG